ncbi:hypothetical protein RDI58_013336 [Solanum bulbocastanum]|uniref:Uncharacterized protein n=1 Tax=Solanum bulbocastanum TaxID=147425 RepID=A0AAN8YF47_SOLBU
MSNSVFIFGDIVLLYDVLNEFFVQGVRYK